MRCWGIVVSKNLVSDLMELTIKYFLKMTIQLKNQKDSRFSPGFASSYLKSVV